MHRKLKVLGVALIAVFALSAVAASSAFAVEGSITPGAFPATLTGSQIGKNLFTIGSAGARKVECSVATFTGTTALSAAATSASVKPAYSGCITSPGGGPATVTVASSCTYSLTATTRSSATEGSGSATVVCSAGGVITIVANSTAGSKICEYTVAGQVASGGITWVSQTSDVLLSLKPTVTVKVISGTLAACGASAGNSTIGTLSGEATATADNGAVGTSLKIS